MLQLIPRNESPAMARALAQIEREFSDPWAKLNLNARVRVSLRLGAGHPKVHRRYARFIPQEPRPIEFASLWLDRAHAQRKALQLTAALVPSARRTLDAFEELRLILRLLRRPGQDMGAAWKFFCHRIST